MTTCEERSLPPRWRSLQTHCKVSGHRRLLEPMPFAWYAGIRDDDLDALVAYLRTLPPLAR